MGIRAQRKKMAKEFKIGDMATWGRCVVGAQVVEIARDGLYVDTEIDGRRVPRHFVPFVGRGLRRTGAG